MISIIICSRDPQTLATVSNNIEATIGISHEIISIDNSRSLYGICQAYNLGAQRSKYDILCFMHEDIIIQTSDWGKIVVNIFQDSTIGTVGVAGSTYLPAAPCPWWETGDKNIRANILHTTTEVTEEIFYRNPTNESLTDVAVLDGVWICTQRKTWQHHPFDEQTFKGFHFYDIDFCTEARKNKRICVTFDIMIEHFSYGSLSNSWTRHAIRYYEKRHKELPIGNTEYNNEEIINLNIRSYVSFIYKLKSSKTKHKIFAKYVLKLFLQHPLHKDSFYHLKELVKTTFK